MSFVKFRTLNDLIKFVALFDAHFLYHESASGHEIYFIHVLGLVEEMVYYARQDEAVKEKYVVYDPYRDEVTFTNKLEVNPPKMIFPFLEIENYSSLSSIYLS